MRLTIIGCAGSFAGPLSPASCYLIQAEDADQRTWSVALDLGSGAFGALQRVIDPFDLDAVVCSHLHPDHCADLSGLAVYRTYHPDISAGKRAAVAVPVWVPEGTSDRLAQMEGKDLGELASECLDVGTLTPGQPLTIGPLRIDVFPALHPVPALSVRVTGPGIVAGTRTVVAYSGDTDVCEGVIEAAEECDAFLCEAAFVEGRDDAVRGIHLTGARAGAVAREASARQLLLTHVPAWNDPDAAPQEAATTYSGPITVVYQGQTIEI